MWFFLTCKDVFMAERRCTHCSSSGASMQNYPQGNPCWYLRPSTTCCQCPVVRNRQCYHCGQQVCQTVIPSPCFFFAEVTKCTIVFIYFYLFIFLFIIFFFWIAILILLCKSLITNQSARTFYMSVIQIHALRWNSIFVLKCTFYSISMDFFYETKLLG